MPFRLEAASKAMLPVDRFEVGQSYVTAKVEDRNGNSVSMNIEGGITGIDLPENLFRLAVKNAYDEV